MLKTYAILKRNPRHRCDTELIDFVIAANAHDALIRVGLRPDFGVDFLGPEYCESVVKSDGTTWKYIARDASDDQRTFWTLLETGAIYTKIKGYRKVYPREQELIDAGHHIAPPQEKKK